MPMVANAVSTSIRAWKTAAPLMFMLRPEEWSSPSGYAGRSLERVAPLEVLAELLKQLGQVFFGDALEFGAGGLGEHTANLHVRVLADADEEDLHRMGRGHCQTDPDDILLRYLPPP